MMKRMKRNMKRRIVRIDDILDLLRDNPKRRFSVREIYRALGFGDRRTIGIMLKALVRYEPIKKDSIYGHVVYYYPRKRK